MPYLTAMSLANKAVYGDFTAKCEGEIEKTNAAVAKRGKTTADAEINISA